MEVFLIPVAPDRYQLYCEIPEEPIESAEADVRQTRRQRVKQWFKQVLAEAEREGRRGAEEPHAADGHRWHHRVKRRVLSRIAEAIAEQRLLWHLRRQSAATAVYPSDITSHHALTIVNRILKADYERHRFWLVVDTLLFVLSGLLAIVPGPNVVAYYFAFRMVGHYLSMRGARQGLDVTRWETRSSAPLTELRQAIGLEPSAREARVLDIASRLQLERLATFFQRTAVPTA